MLSLSDSSDVSAAEDDPDPAPVLLRRRRFVRRKDRAVHDLASAQEATNYDPILPPTRKAR